MTEAYGATRAYVWGMLGLGERSIAAIMGSVDKAIWEGRLRADGRPRTRRTYENWRDAYDAQFGGDSITEPGTDPGNLFVGQLIEPPGLDDLLEGGVPPEHAPYLLAWWVVEHERGHGLCTMMCQRASEVFRDFPDIPYEQAKALASIEVRGEFFGVDFVIGDMQNVRRFRPWQSEGNEKAMRQAVATLHEVRQGRRKSPQRKALLSYFRSR